VHLAGHTYAFRRFELEHALARIAEVGFTDVELWIGHVDRSTDRVSAVLERAGLRARAVSAGGYYRVDDEAPLRAADVARAVGAEVVVSCAAPALVPLLEERLGIGVALAVENHWDQPLDRARRIIAALDATSRAGACLDTGHALVAGETPCDAAAFLGARLAHVHLKEGRKPSLLERIAGRRARKRFMSRPPPVWPGDGDLDIRSFRRTLEGLRFDGTVSLEHEGDDPERALSVLFERWNEADQAT
jgi:inosose dehydratase